MPRFWDWIGPEAETEEQAVLVLSGMIDSGSSWYEDTVYPAMFRAELDAHAGRPVRVEINSPGGDVFAGFEIYNMLREHQGGLQVRVTGLAASAASIVAMAADPGELAMYDASMMMIHKPWICAAGNADALREHADTLDMIRDVMCSAYMRRYSGTEDALRALLDRDTYLTPQQALDCGLCDRILTWEAETQEEGAAAAMIGRYAAMDMRALRDRLGVRAGDKAAGGGTPQAARNYLAEVDAILRDIM